MSKCTCHDPLVFGHLCHARARARAERLAADRLANRLVLAMATLRAVPDAPYLMSEQLFDRREELRRMYRTQDEFGESTCSDS